ncbi:MAG: hypothetical protein AAGG68_10095 [Bacteroidota bacterium]
MKKQLLHLLLLFFCLPVLAQHQTIQPYEELGIEVEVLTLSDGKYQEMIPNDTLVRMGSVLFNHITGEVASVVVEDTIHEEYGLKADVASRFLSRDPLARDFPFYTPYQFAGNMPIEAIDLEGAEPRKVKRLAIEKEDKPLLKMGTWTLISYENGEKVVRTSHGIVWSYEYYLIGERDKTFAHTTNKTFYKSGDNYYELSENGTFSPKTSKTLQSYLDELQRNQDGANVMSDNASIVVDIMRGGKGGKADDVLGMAKKNKYIGRSRDNLLKSKKSYEKLIRDHVKKLEDFKKDPIGNTSPSRLRQMMGDNPSKEELLRRAKGRIKALEDQIRKQRGELQKVNEALDQINKNP